MAELAEKHADELEQRVAQLRRAAATVLRDHGIRGRFHAVHRDGRLTLERA